MTLETSYLGRAGRDGQDCAVVLYTRIFTRSDATMPAKLYKANQDERCLRKLLGSFFDGTCSCAMPCTHVCIRNRPDI